MLARLPMSTALSSSAPTASSPPPGFAYVVLMLPVAPCSPDAPEPPLAPVELELPLPQAARPRAAVMTATIRARRIDVVLSAALTRRAQYPGSRRKSMDPLAAVDH